MKAIVLMFDSLNKQMLSAYGCHNTITPNFKRVAEKTVKFDNFYVGSMPCMPARRELHTGRYNFLHRSWGPIEPFDVSMPEILKKCGIHSHLVTDHKHYWRDGGATYHPRFSTYEFIRGQEGDNWKGVVDKPNVTIDTEEPEENKQRKIVSRTQHLINIQYMQNEQDTPLARTINSGIEFIEKNHQSDNWFLQLECFDPHEPFFVPEKYLQMYGVTSTDFDGWPPYYFCTETEERKQTIQRFYKALLTMVDDYVGKVLDKMDEHDLWQDTMLIINTDHGFLLGEHEWWGKNIMPLYNEIANTPFFIWHPQLGKKNETRQALAQTIDIPATILDFFNIEKPKAMLGHSILPAVNDDTPIRDYALFGYHGCHINITDGQYVYMRSPIQEGTDNLYEYTLMPTRINRRFTPKELQHIELHPGFDFTQSCAVLKIPTESVMTTHCDRFGHRLYDVKHDPKQLQLLDNTKIECHLTNQIRLMMIENDAPDELYPRYGLNKQQPVTMAQINEEHLKKTAAQTLLDDYPISKEVQFGTLALLKYLTQTKQESLKKLLLEKVSHTITTDELFTFVAALIPPEQHSVVFYRMALDMRLN